MWHTDIAFRQEQAENRRLQIEPMEKESAPSVPAAASVVEGRPKFSRRRSSKARLGAGSPSSFAFFFLHLRAV